MLTIKGYIIVYNINKIIHSNREVSMKKSFYLLGAYLIVLVLSSCKNGKETEIIEKGKNVDKVEIVAQGVASSS
jgi:hypothetical protein